MEKFEYEKPKVRANQLRKMIVEVSEAWSQEFFEKFIKELPKHYALLCDEWEIILIKRDKRYLVKYNRILCNLFAFVKEKWQMRWFD